MLAELFYLVGAATAVALMRLKRADRARALVWLDALETMVRKLLLIEAAAITLDRRRPRRHLSACSGHAGEGAGGPGKPSFALLPPNARDKPHPARIRLLGAAASVAEIWRERERAARIARLRESPAPQTGARFARRIAALASVIANPIPHARRLARLMRNTNRVPHPRRTAQIDPARVSPGRLQSHGRKSAARRRHHPRFKLKVGARGFAAHPIRLTANYALFLRVTPAQS
jgi:hypothetical protein